MSTQDSNVVCLSDVVAYDLRNQSTAYVHYFFYTGLEKILITVIIPFIWVIGLMANVAFIYVVIRLRHMRTMTNYYLLNLAIADIMFLCFTGGDKISRYVVSPVRRDAFKLKAVGCALLNFFVQLSFYSSIFFVTLVTLEKYYAVGHPVLHRLITGRKRTIKMLSGAWLLASVLSAILIPAWAGWISYCLLWPDFEMYSHMPNLVGYCQPLFPVMQTVASGLQTLPFFIVMTANFVMYALIVRAFNVRVAVRQQWLKRDAVDTRGVKMRNQVARMLIVNGIIFFVTLTPYQCMSFLVMISHFIGKYPLKEEQMFKFQWAGRILSYINSAINPFVYAFVNPRYKRAFLKVFAGCPGRKGKTVVKTKANNRGTPISMEKKENNSGSRETSRRTSNTDA